MKTARKPRRKTPMTTRRCTTKTRGKRATSSSPPVTPPEPVSVEPEPLLEINGRSPFNILHGKPIPKVPTAQLEGENRAPILWTMSAFLLLTIKHHSWRVTYGQLVASFLETPEDDILPETMDGEGDGEQTEGLRSGLRSARRLGYLNIQTFGKRDFVEATPKLVELLPALVSGSQRPHLLQRFAENEEVA